MITIDMTNLISIGCLLIMTSFAFELFDTSIFEIISKAIKSIKKINAIIEIKDKKGNVLYKERRLKHLTRKYLFNEKY